MKSIALKTSLLALFVLTVALIAVSCGRKDSDDDTLYTCGMHPQVIQNHPGNCPICGMKLTPIRKDAIKPAAPTNNPDSGSPVISIDPATVQTMNIRTALISRGPLRRALRTVATIDFDETTLTDVTTKFRGWIEKLYVDSTGSQVMHGDPLFSIYSPDLYSAQTEFLLALNSAPADASMTNPVVASALAKLQYFDISPEQIADLEKTRQPKKALVVQAAHDGIVVSKNAVEGQMVDPGMQLYRLADLSIVWVMAEIYEQDLPFVRLGQEATVGFTYMPDRKFRGRVTYIYPTVDDKTRTARVRLEFHNPGYFLKPGMFASVDLETELAPDAILIPDSSVLRGGEQNTVFVALAGGRFEARAVVLGADGENGQCQVLSGVAEGERVVTDGQFMLDSESQLREAIRKMASPVASTAAPATNAIHTLAAAVPGATNILYICPMPEHVSIVYDHPGDCPICGMALVPVTRAELQKLQPGGKVLYYTCPMPEHSDVHSDKPGKCPKCGMTLIPVMETPGTAPAPPAATASPDRPHP